MCGRFTSFSEPAAMQAMLRPLGTVPPWPTQSPPRYNIAPTQPTLTVTANTDKTLSVTPMTFGMYPAFMQHGIINARAETVADKPMFRQALVRHRCLVLANGFYEWGKDASGKKVPVYFGRADGHPFFFAGLYRAIDDATRKASMQNATHGFVIITTEANALVSPVHHRMPVMLNEQAAQRWLKEDVPTPALQAMLVPYTAQAMHQRQTDPRINSPRFEGTCPF